MADGVLAGLDRLRAHFPALRSGVGTSVILFALLGVFAGTTVFFLLVDRYIPEWMPDGEILVLAIGFLVLSRFFTQKDRYLARFGQRAYERAFTAFGIPGLGIIFGAIAHLAYMPGPLLPAIWWKPYLIGLGWSVLVAGILLWWRAMNALGIDYLTMLYVYFPAERRIVDTGMYQLVRHPVYGAALSIGTGLALIHAGWYSLLVALLLQLFFLGWIRLVEERELMLHLPEYVEYRRRVPAFAPKLRNLARYYRLLLLGEPQVTP